MRKHKKFRILAAIMAVLFTVQVMPYSSTAAESDVDGTVDHEAIISQLHSDSDDASSDEAQAIVAEAAELRSENEKHYRLEDGSYIAAQYSAPVHYMDGDGNWVDIDNTLIFEESMSDDDFDGYTNKDNSFSVKLAENSEDRLFRLEDGENSISMKLGESSAESAEISVEDTDDGVAAQSELSVEEQNEKVMSLDALTSKAEYTDVMPGVDLEYTVMPDGIKEYIVVNEKLDGYDFSFELSIGDMSLRENDDNSISIMTADGEEKYIIPAPYMTDANDKCSYAVEYTVADVGDGVYTLTVSADANWIDDDETAFPVKIDPTVITADKDFVFTEAYVSSADNHANIVHKNTSSVMVGYEGNNYKTTRAYINWRKTISAPASYVPVSAKLKYYQSNKRRDENPIIEVHPVSQKWDTETLTWNNQPEISDEVIDSVVVKLYRDMNCVEFDVTKIVIDYLNGNDTYGVVLKEKNDDTKNSEKKTYVDLYTTSYGDELKRPVLEIRYINQTGLSDEHSYVPFDLGSYGTAYVNTYNGDVAFVYETLNTDMLKLNHVYNTYRTYSDTLKNSIDHYTGSYPEMSGGKGWKMSVQDSIFETSVAEIEQGKIIIPGTSDEEKTEEQIAKEKEPAYVYNDEYGTNVYLFYDDQGKNYKDRQGLGYILTVDEDTYTLLKVRSGSLLEKKFKVLPYTTENITRNVGYIVSCNSYSNNNGNHIINYTYADADSTKMSKIEIYKADSTTADVTINMTAGSDNQIGLITIGTRTIKFTYGSANFSAGNLLKISDSRRGTTFFEYNSDSKLTSIKTPDEVILEFNYNANSKKLSEVILDDPYYDDIVSAEFTFDTNATTVNYYGDDADDTADDLILKYFFDENGDNTFAYAVNPKLGVYERFAANGLKGLNCGAINSAENNIILYMEDDVIAGSDKFAMNSNLRYNTLRIEEYYDDAYIGISSYKFTRYSTSNRYKTLTKDIFTEPANHTLTAYVKYIGVEKVIDDDGNDVTPSEDEQARVVLSLSDKYGLISSNADMLLTDCKNGWVELSVDLDSAQDLTAIYGEEEIGDYVPTVLTMDITIESQVKGTQLLIDNVTIDGRPLSFPTKGNALFSSGFESIYYENNADWDTANTDLNYANFENESENVAFGERSAVIQGSISREKSIYHTEYMKYTTSDTKYRLSGWGKASSLPLNDDGSNGFELFAYYIYYVATKETDENGNVSVKRGEMKTVSTAIPFDWKNEDWQYASAVLNAPEENLADNQEIQIYSITVGALYKNNIGNAYFDNIELVPVQ